MILKFPIRNHPLAMLTLQLTLGALMAQQLVVPQNVVIESESDVVAFVDALGQGS
jgi:hypothetical protein